MMFANDTMLFGKSKEQIEANLERWRKVLEKGGMRVSRNKTENLGINQKENEETIL